MRRRQLQAKINGLAQQLDQIARAAAEGFAAVSKRLRRLEEGEKVRNIALDLIDLRLESIEDQLSPIEEPYRDRDIEDLKREALERCIEQQTVVRFDYTKPGEELATERVVSPYEIVERGEVVMVGAWDMVGSGSYKTFRLDRMSNGRIADGFSYRLPE